MSEADGELDRQIARVLTAYEVLMARVAMAHAPELLEIGVTMPQLKILYLVHARGELRMSELPGTLGVSLSTVSGIVDRLVEQGFLLRREAREDRRHVEILLTPAGLAHLDHLRELDAAQLRRLLVRLSPADLDVVERALAVLSEAAAASTADAAAVPATADPTLPPPSAGSLFPETAP